MATDMRLQERIERVRALLSEIHHPAIATVNEDGSPHNSPVFMAFDRRLNGIWASHPETWHSKNIARTGQAFVTFFDSREGHGGLFARAEAAELTDESEARRGYDVLRELKENFYGVMGDFDLYFGAGPLRIYRARPLQLWVNLSDRDQNGVIIRDHRAEVKLEDLLR